MHAKEQVVVSQDLKDFIRVWDDVSAHNKQHGPSGMLIGIFMAATHGERPRVDNSQSNLSSDALMALHHPILERLGLALEPVEGRVATLFAGSGERQKDSQVRFGVSDPDRLVAFLSTIHPSATQVTKFAEALSFIPTTVTLQVGQSYNLNAGSDDALNVFACAGRVVGEYQRLNLPDAVQQLSEYLGAARAGFLREHVLVERLGLLRKPGENFGPADWILDATTDFLTRKWDNAIKALAFIKENSKCAELFKQLGSHLLDCVAHSENHIDRVAYLAGERDMWTPILRDARKRIEGLM